MQNWLSVKDLKQLPDKDHFSTTLLLKKVNVKVAKNGNEFLQVELGDANGSFTCNCFHGTEVFRFFKEHSAGDVVSISGQIDYYSEKLSPKLKEAKVLTEEEKEEILDLLIEKPQEKLDALQKELEEYANKIKHKELSETVKQVFQDLGENFINSFGAISMHHAYLHGLLEHTVHVTRSVIALLPLYPEINKDLATAGALLHDVGKTLEYTRNDEGISKSRIGLLQGHVVLGYRLVRSAGIRCKLQKDYLERLEHIILSHQGQLEWGAATLAATPEAVFVSLVDNLDAKMGMIHSALKKALPEQEMSDFIPGLQTKLILSKIE